MNQMAGFICFGVLAEGIFDLIGPLFIFGIYILAALAKGWAKKRQKAQPDKAADPYLQKAVRKRYQQFYDRNVGKSRVTAKIQTPRPPEPGRAVPVHGIHKRPEPTPEISEKPAIYPVQNQRHRQPVQQKLRVHRNVRQKPVISKAQTPMSIDQTIPTCDKKHTENIFTSMIYQPTNLRTAIILKEILDKPLAMRG